MARGGSRPGAGRKKGSISPETRARREVAAAAVARAMEEGITPLEVILTVMRDVWREATVNPDRLNQPKAMQAVMLAEKAAPYLHSKMAAVEHSGPDGGPVKTEVVADDAFRDLVAAMERLAGSATANSVPSGGVAGDSKADAASSS